MYENLRDREKLWLTGKALRRLLVERDAVYYIQKAHFHAAAPFLLHRLGFAPNYILDYDDYDVPLSNFFGRGTLNRLFFGSNRWDEITRRLAQRAYGCVAASHGLHDFLSQMNDRVAFIPTGVDAEAFRPADPSEERKDDRVTFLWNGLVWGEPIVENLVLLFRAYDWVMTQMPPSRLLLIGGGAMWEEVKRRAQCEFPRLPIEWREWARPQEMPALLHEADVALLPTAGDDPWLRCKSPTKLFEYMASGLPVVASAVGEAAHVVEHLRTGLLGQNERDFAQAMLRVAAQKEMRVELGRHAREAALARYSLPILGESLYAFLTSLFPDKLN